MKTRPSPLRPLLACLLWLPLAAAARETPPLAPESIATALEAARDASLADPYRPGFHLAPLAGFMADPDAGLFHDGHFHLFYMHQPFGPGSDGLYYWAHARSKNLVDWQHQPPRLVPPREHGVWSMMSGSGIIAPNDRPTLFYSSFVEDQILQLRVVGDRDMSAWEHPDRGEPVMSIDHPGVPDFIHPTWRDPFVFRARDRHFMLLCAERFDRPETLVVICESTDPDLEKWHYRGIFHQHPKRDFRNMEVPELRRVDGRWVLLFSCDAPRVGTRWIAGEVDWERLRFEPGPVGVLDHSEHFYAQETLPGPDGEVFLIGWIPGWDRSWMPDYREDRRKNRGEIWNGCFSLPRRLSFDDQGQLVQTPIAALEALRGAPVRWEEPRELVADTVLAKIHPVKEIRGDQLEVAVEFDLLNAGFCGLKLLADEDGRGGLPIRWSGDLLQVDGVAIPMPSWKPGETLELRIFVDRAYVEVFAAGGRFVATRKLFPERIGGDHLAFTHIGGNARVVRFEAWPLKSASLGFPKAATNSR